MLECVCVCVCVQGFIQDFDLGREGTSKFGVDVEGAIAYNWGEGRLEACSTRCVFFFN